MTVDWAQWQPRIRCVLVFIIKDGQILLIRKKRGLGAGKINGPGGKLDPGETTHQAAVREIQEEVGVTPLRLESKGELSFQFVDGLSLHCEVFQADDFTGTLIETAEAIPLWFPLGEIPYAEMWADDPLWLPQMIAGEKFRGFFVFADDQMLQQRVEFFPTNR